MQYKENEKLLIIHVDDIGMSHASNLAAERLFKKGIVTSGAVMLPCSWAYDFVKWHRENPQHEIGIHLTHTCEWDACRWRQLSDRSRAPGLIDPEGFMWKGFNGELRTVSPREYAHEMESQIEQALKWGMKANHIDSHMGINTATPEFFDLFLQAAGKYGLIPNIPHWALFNDEMWAVFGKYDYLQIVSVISSGEGEEYAAKKAAFYEQLKKVKPGLNYTVIHPVVDMPEIREIIPVWKERVLEYELFMDDELRRWMEDMEIRAITWAGAVNWLKKEL